MSNKCSRHPRPAATQFRKGKRPTQLPDPSKLSSNPLCYTLMRQLIQKAVQVNPPSSSGLTSAAPARFAEVSSSGQGPPAAAAGWGTPKQAAASSAAPQPSSLAPGGPSQTLGSSLLNSLQVGSAELHWTARCRAGLRSLQQVWDCNSVSDRVQAGVRVQLHSGPT